MSLYPDIFNGRMVEGDSDGNLNNLPQQNMEIIRPTLDLSTKKSHLPKQYYCKVCGQGFTRKHNMISHELIHSSLKPHVCLICNLKFRRVHDLKRHEKLHTGEKPYVCNKCFKGFARTDALVRHQNSTNACSGNRKDRDEAKYTGNEVPTGNGYTGNEGDVRIKSASPSRVPILNRPKIFGYNISNGEQFRIPSFQKLAIYNPKNSINNHILQSPINLNGQNQPQAIPVQIPPSMPNQIPPIIPNQIPPIIGPNQIPIPNQISPTIGPNQIPPLQHSPNHPIHSSPPSRLQTHSMPPVGGIPLPPVSIPMTSIPAPPILSTSLPSVDTQPMRYIPPPPGYYLSSNPINHVPNTTQEPTTVMKQEQPITEAQQATTNTHVYPSRKSQQSEPTPGEADSGRSATPELEKRLDKPNTI